MLRIIAAVPFLLCLVAAPVQAQFDDLLWGVSGTVNPSWKAPSYVGYVFGAKDDTAQDFSLEGSQLSIGFVRGKTLGGEWGISLVRTAFKDGSFALREDGTRVITQKNTVLGGEIHRFFVFGTIKQRVQIGMNLGIGAGQIRGQVETVSASGSKSTLPGKDFLQVEDRTIPVCPLFKAELAIAGIIRPGLKARLNMGVNFPGYQKVSVTATYLFGAR